MSDFADSCDYFDGVGIYHNPSWDGHQHHVAEKKLTTRELCVEVKRILDDEPLLVYLEYESDVIVRYFINWYLLKPEDVPLYVWIDEEEIDGRMARQFFYETFRGRTDRFYVGPGMSPPKEALESTQTALKVEDEQTETQHVKLKYCQMGECGKTVKHTVAIKTGYSVDVCEDHYQGIQEQLAKAKEAKEAKLAARREARKHKPKKKKMSVEEAQKLIKQSQRQSKHQQ